MFTKDEAKEGLQVVLKSGNTIGKMFNNVQYTKKCRYLSIHKEMQIFVNALHHVGIEKQ